MSLKHVSVSICHEMLNPVMLFNWCCAKLLGNYLSLFRNSILNVLIMTIPKLQSVHVNEKDSIQACDVFIKLESEKHKLHVSDTGSTWWYT
jgi:hypothetical protein